ncbi:MAG: glucosaminidase domain-containing protein [Caulobacteraceae bacterium]|nr:glucosaminidase domain-containing protein [Caulobacter sp.]
MAGLHHVRISASVGRGGRNLHFDVTEVQDLINAHLPPGLRPLAVDGVCGRLTEAAVVAVERDVVHALHPDGRIDPHGPTLRALNRSLKLGRHPQADLAPSTAAAPAAAARPLAARLTRPRSAAPATSAHAAAQRVTGRRAVPDAVIAAARAAQAKWKAPASITIAQWMIESAWGRHMPVGSNNPFGIKATKNQLYVLARTREEVNGRSVYIEAKFRKFGSLDEAFDAHGKLLAQGPAFALARTHLDDPDAYADALTHHYATDSQYGSTLKSQMRAYDLYQYDR